ncbi:MULTISPECIES: filamentous hemagglutinin N-terminal domain-containing protein [Moorena]|uniref:Hemagglutination activity domain protein n=1 Tax=Moorena producens 3L TaxID=489825 RepID=F4XLK9_9CYAN|nr:MULTISPECIES: filamentous hemagglutinin N-terminal domain-containing protein [Moorena]EGJ34484.1 hemagglutination activity domain protein [Moorena producens 3L]NEP69425.1 filamentous hemagglutinin N-terminal domain-containing protein [Moorena sp. SIO3A5]OLT68229.1 hypothetical protein BI334_27340 [Moorena producens 3L]
MNNQQSKSSTRGLGILPLTEKALTLIGWVVIAFSGNYALAQITPDQTLGNESSVVTPNATIRGEPGDLIEGGAARGSNLFHSFQDFNVGQLQRVYFANPAGIENILSRVTGSNISNILGTLGVDGGANLFLLNPNGIVFGQNARLDVAGSFFASTANSLVFNNGTEFSATNPQAPPLLSINITPGLQYGLNHPKPTKITNAGYLVVGQDLTLAAGHLDLQGQLIAGGDLTLHAEDTVQIRDSIGQPFIAAAGGKLLIQGNQGVDIFALNHPDSGLFSGGDLVLRTQNTVAGDAHYWSGGSFRIEQLDGSLGDLFSPDDPIIRSVGDVSFNSYLGTSLHIVAGGAVEIGSVIITGNETGTEGIDFISEAITLSNGTVVDINGQTEPTLDVRAGVDPNQVGIPGLTGNQFFGDLFNLNLFGRPTITNTATSADIKIGTIAFANVNILDLLFQNISANDLLAGKVLLTNQYKPNPSLAGDIEVSATLGSLVPTLANLAIQNGEVLKGGSVTIDSRGSITLNGIVNTIAIPNNDPSNPIPNDDPSKLFSGNGGDVTFLANDNITLNPGSFIASAGIEGGKITLNSGSNFLLDDSGVVTVTTGAGVGGNLIVNAPESVTLINREGSGFSNLGELVTNFTNSNLLERLLGFNGSGLATVTTGPGNSGDLTINTRTLSIQNQAQNQESGSLAGATTIALSGSSGKSGDLTVNAESVEIVGNETGPFIPTPNERLALAIRDIPTGLTTATIGSGKGGNLTINTQSLTIQDGAGVTTGTVETDIENPGDGGNLTINATESVTLSGKAALATGTLNSSQAGELKVNTPTLTLGDGAVIAADTTGSGDAGDLTINTEQLLVRDGSRIGAATGNTGTGAKITVIASDLVELVGTAVDDQNTVVPSGIFANSQFINDASNQLGDAGNINIDTEKLIVQDGAVVSTSTQGEGIGGEITIDVNTLEITTGGQLRTTAFGDGRAGNITLNIDKTVVIANPNSGLLAETEGAGAGGTITINTQDLTLQDEAQISASTSGTGTSGSIVVENADSVQLADNSSISTEVKAGAEVNASPGEEVGTIDIETRSLKLTNGSDITASTAGNGDAGNIELNAIDTVSLANGSTISTAVEPTGMGKGGQIKIHTEFLYLNKTNQAQTNPSQITASTSGKGSEITSSTSGIGDAGSIFILDAKQVNIDHNSSISTAVNTGAVGKGGDVEIETKSLSLNNESEILASTAGVGNGGNVEIGTESLSLDNNSKIEASTAGEGNAGSIVVKNADSVTLNQNSSISTEVKEGAVAQKDNNIAIDSNIDIKTRTLTLNNDSNITASTSGIGNAGSITIQEAQQVDLNRNSSISTAVNTKAVGNGGNVDIETKSLSLDHTSKIEASTAGVGNAGSITIPDAEEVNLNRNSSISTAVNSGADAEKAGNIDLKTRSLTLTNGAEITASTTGIGDAGSITIQEAQQVDLDLNSSISTAVNTGAEGNGGNVDIETKSLSLDHISTIEANTAGVGNGGNVDIESKHLSLDNESKILASTDSQGDAGSITIQDAQQVDLDLNSSISTAVNTGAVGNGGNVDIETKSLSLDHTSKIEASTAGNGNAGSITIPDAEEVSLNRNSSISTAVNTGAVGNGGDVDLKTRTLKLTNDSEITASTAGDGDAGNITLQADQVTIQGDSQVSATTSSVTNTDRGKGGNINIIEANRFEATDGGNVRTTTEGNKQAGNITLEVRDDITLAGAGSGLFANTTRGSSGDGGNIFVDPRTLTIRDKAKIAVDSQGQGKGGSITLEAGTLTLNNKAELSAETASTQGGNITLTIDELLFLRRNSKISTTAGTAQAGGNGGNIEINAPFILGIRQENSDITANAFEGNGGNITITTQGIIGLEFREKLTPLSDITASSEFGLDGTVNINAPGIDPSRGLSELPTDIIDASQLIEKNLCAAGEGSEFTATGRGGLPVSPNETLNPNATWDDWRITEQPQTRIRRRRSRSRQHQLQINQPQTNKPKPKQIVEAQGWVIGANGEVILTAHPVIVTPKGTWLHKVDCPMLHQTFKQLR